ncbi:helix-turn-helix transcriptional regulator [Streptomyces sp. NBC_01166]|uniref:helix-turn-helix domain-containing protein n=1 Tax=Streptomyces sp. NBC_01166 TaxID=2903755 RepID=UPI003862DDF6|nr:helix-turn-helix transcriptional regulator [Streptomyces sp. NBC_01166]
MIREPRLNELGEFLKARRAEVTPEQAGLADDGQRRRVTGLRREEVARLAAVSTEYYTRIEQGRLQASAPLLDDLARVLHLNVDQRAYLFDLAAKPTPSTAPRAQLQQVDEQVQRMLDDLTATPAFVIGRCTDVLAWNSLAAAVFTDFAAIPDDERSYIRLLFTDPAMQRLYADWEEVTRLAIAQLRMETTRYPDEPRLAALVQELTASDARFRRWWGEHDVAARGKGTKVLHHPVVGELSLDWDTLICGPDPDQNIVIWTAAPGSPSRGKLQLLA